MSASGARMLGALPPSSSETRLSARPATAPISRPTSVEPVNETLATSGCSTSARPVPGPPVTTLTTPAGTPACSISSTSRSVLNGVCSAGLITTVLPVASAGASFQARIISGKFHGVISAQTPSGSRRVR